MKILVVLYFDLKKTEFIGVQKKIYNQVSAMQKLGHDVDLAYCQEDKFLIENQGKTEAFDIKPGLTHYRESIQKTLNQLTKDRAYDMAYLRFPGSIDPSMLKTFKHLKKNGLKVVLEMPTYPIGGELLGRLHQLKDEQHFLELGLYSFAYMVHLVCSRRIYKYLTRIVTYAPYETIWRTKTIMLDNGVNVEECPTVQKIWRDDHSIIMLGVACVSIWHGYDRVIEGLYQYYSDGSNSQKVVFKIVGNSPLVLEFKEKVKEYALEDVVEFHGSLTGQRLYEEYCNADIGISSLGMHRINVLYGSPLKTKEYCSFGLPFILGYQEKLINESFPFALLVEADESPINIKDVVRFYERIKEIPDYQNIMHDFAMRNYDWTAQMKSMFEHIK